MCQSHSATSLSPPSFSYCSNWEITITAKIVPFFTTCFLTFNHSLTEKSFPLMQWQLSFCKNLSWDSFCQMLLGKPNTKKSGTALNSLIPSKSLSRLLWYNFPPAKAVLLPPPLYTISYAGSRHRSVEVAYRLGHNKIALISFWSQWRATGWAKNGAVELS